MEEQNIKVYVLNKHGKPLMPCKPRKARILLKQKKAKVVNTCPFTIKLIYGSSGYKQKTILKMDTGSKNIGLSVVCPKTKEELYSGEVELRNDIQELLSTRKELRRSRRNRKTRYRKPRFKNRAIPKKWLSPSIKQKIQCHIQVVKDINKILSITNIIVETASFDIQKIKNLDINGKEYQEGEQLNFWNTREYVLFRDNHTCQYCKGKSKDKILNVHHIESRKTGGNAPNNLITLCKTCHDNYHKGKISLPKTIKRGMSFKDATFMGIMRWALYEELKNIYGNDKVSMTFGYITKNNRIENNLPKMHRIDALCIEEPNAKEYKRLSIYYYQRKIRCHNRQIHKQKASKGGKRKLNQAPYKVCGFRLFDKVLFNKKICFISGRRSTGYFKLITLDKTVLHNSAKAKDLKLLQTAKSYLTETRKNII